MAINKEKKMLELFQQLPESEQNSAIDYLEYLSSKIQEDFDMEAFFEGLPEDDEPLTEEEIKKLSEPDEFVSWEEAKRELQTDRDSK